VGDSGKVGSSDESYVPYGGPALAPGTSYTWTVRTWDRDGQASPYAPPASFDTGLGDHDWSGAQWIRRVTSGNDSADDYTLARKQFSLGASPVTRARVYVSAMAQYELHVNGRAVYRGDSFDYPGEGALPDAAGHGYVGAGEGAPQRVGDGVFTVGAGDTHFSPGARANSQMIGWRFGVRPQT
jgi:hypothetical protein